MPAGTNTPPYRGETAKGWGTRLGGDSDGVGVVGGVGLEAAPVPCAGFCDESSCDRVAVDVAELFDSLSLREDVEVVVAGLPDVVFGSGAGETLLEDLDG